MSHYQVEVRTADIDGAGTDANVFVSLVGANGYTGQFLLDNPNSNDMERGSTCRFVLRSVPDVIDLRALAVWLDNSGDYAAWHPHHITLKNLNTQETYDFPCDVWLEGETDPRHPEGGCTGVGLYVDKPPVGCVARSNKPSESPWDAFWDFWEDFLKTVGAAPVFLGV